MVRSTILPVIAAGLLFALSLPPYNVAPLAWVALAPLLVACGRPGRRPLHAYGFGMLTAILAGMIHARWNANTDALRYAYLPFLWLGLVLGAVGAAAAWARTYWNSAADAGRWIVFVACAGVAVEWLTTLSPLPVGIALTQYQMLPVLQIASVTGMWGVSLLLYLANAAVADLLLRPRSPALRPLAVVLGLIAVCLAAGAGSLLSGRPTGDTVRVAAVQDFTGAESSGFDAGRTAGAPADVEELMRGAAQKGARLIVGSEEGLGSAFFRDDPKDSMNRLARETGTSLVVGYQERADPKDYNCAALIGPDGTTRAVHRKIKLFLGERASVQAGRETTVTAASALSRSDAVRVGMLICFDTCYPNIVRAEAIAGAQIIAVPNYDPPTPGMVLHHLHAALMPFRAVENRVAIIRADPNGASMVVDPSGRIVARVSLFTAAAATADVHLRASTQPTTFYTRFGDWLAYLCMVGIIALLLIESFRQLKPRL